MVLGAEIGSADIGEDGLSDKSTERRGGGTGEQGKEGLEQTDMVMRDSRKVDRGRTR